MASTPTMLCNEPLQIIGVQSETPMAWSPCGNILAFVSGNKSVVLCEQPAGGSMERGTPMAINKVLVGHRAPVTCLRFHPTHPKVPHLVSCGHDGLIVWDTEHCRIAHHFSPETAPDVAHESTVQCAEWAFEGAVLVTGSKDTNIKIWCETRSVDLLCVAVCCGLREYSGAPPSSSLAVSIKRSWWRGEARVASALVGASA